MSKTYMMGDGKLTEEDRLALDQAKIGEDQLLKEVQLRDQQNEQKKNKVTLRQLLATKINPHEDRVLVWPDPIESTTEGGIIKPKEVIEKERPMMGTVLAVGPAKKLEISHTNKLLLAILRFHENNNANSYPQSGDLEREMEAHIPLHPGMRVLYGRFAGTETLDPETKEPLLIMRPTDIFANV
jgi:co-chaperonin GroES (HSP10)